MHSPPKIKQIRILEDPFGDIIPRITAAEKRAQQLAKEQIQRERAEQGKRRQGRKLVSTIPMYCRRTEANQPFRDTKLLSFGDDADANDGTQFKKKPLFRTDRMFRLYSITLISHFSKLSIRRPRNW
jgi:peptidyl-prolyl cis-trans isomerase SDCCAG10